VKSAAKPTTAAKSAAVNVKPKSTVPVGSVGAQSAASSAASKKAPSKAIAQQTAHRPVQQQPTPERYRQIQQALLDKGYFGGPVDGEWGSSSVDSLKRFQHDQSLAEDGKIGSVSLIALGLGPKREGIPKPADKPPAPPPDNEAGSPSIP
jgi:peptidoglycan hydrolase-like protein with peptidoglycan-binding domain